MPALVALVFVTPVRNFGRSSASGWGAAMSTDTAFALGVLALA
jgi:Na+/H+ antiporter NhaA